MDVDAVGPVNLRCSAIVFRAGQILLLLRDRGASTGVDWVLPGGTPRAGESAASCVRREVAEETGLQVSLERVAFLLEASNPLEGTHQLDAVFTCAEMDPTATPDQREAGLTPLFYPVEQIARLQLRPPIAGHVRALLARGGRGEGVYLGNVWRPRDRAGAVPTVG